MDPETSQTLLRGSAAAQLGSRDDLPEAGFCLLQHAVPVLHERGSTDVDSHQLQAVALNEGLPCEKRLWRTERPQLESFQLAPWASRRRSDLLELLDRLNPTIAELSQAVE